MGNKSSTQVLDKPVVVIVGAGYGGLLIAKLLDKDAHWNVVLIDRKNHHVHNMAACRAVTEPGYEEEILIPYANVLKYGSIVQAEVTEITPGAVMIHGHDEPVKFDYLIIATGSSYAFPGKLAESKRELAIDKYKACQQAVKAASNIAIVGGGPVGVELAGEIVTDLPEKKVTLIHSRPHLCEEPGILEAFSVKVETKLQALGVSVLLGERIILEESKEDNLLLRKQQAVANEDYDLAKKLKNELDELTDTMAKVQINLRDDLPVNYLEGKRTLETVKGTKVETDLVFFCMGTQVANRSLGAFEGVMERGRLKVDGNLRVEGQQNVFALGDIAPIGAMMGYFAQEQAKYLANYFNKSIRLGKKVKPYPPQAPASIVSIGRKAGAAQLMGHVFGSSVAGAIKSKDLFTSTNWAAMNMDRKTKLPKASVAKGNQQAVSLAAAMQISESQAQAIKKGELPELTERDDYIS